MSFADDFPRSKIVYYALHAPAHLQISMLSHCNPATGAGPVRRYHSALVPDPGYLRVRGGLRPGTDSAENHPVLPVAKEYPGNNYDPVTAEPGARVPEYFHTERQVPQTQAPAQIPEHSS